MIEVVSNGKTYLVSEDKINVIVPDGKDRNVLWLSSNDKLIIDDASAEKIYADMEYTAYESLESTDENYLYEITYKNIDYDFADKYFSQQYRFKEGFGGCSSVRNGNLHMRNYDLYYSETAQFVVHTPGVDGVSDGLMSLTKQIVDENPYSTAFRVLPFYLTDGHNQYGLTANINVVPKGDKGAPTTGTNPGKESVCTLMFVRYILDHYKTVDEVVDAVLNDLNIWSIDSKAFDYEFHYMVSDPNKTVVIEFINNKPSIIEYAEEDKPIMTNFYLTGVELNFDGSVYTPETQDETHNAKDTNNITDFGAGLERFNTINEKYSALTTIDAAKSLLDTDILYSNTYTNEGSCIWYSEYVGKYSGGRVLTVTDDVEKFNESNVLTNAAALYANRSRDINSPYYGTWHTMHGVVYDIDNREMYLFVQDSESKGWKTFTL